MPPVVRVDDVHACGAKDTEGSKNTFVNNKEVHRIGDADSHTTQAEGSPNVFINSIPVARVGDKNNGCPLLDCPCAEATGSPDTIVN